MTRREIAAFMLMLGTLVMLGIGCSHANTRELCVLGIALVDMSVGIALVVF